MAVRGGPARRVPMEPQTGVMREQARAARRPAPRPQPAPGGDDVEALIQRAAQAAAQEAAAEVRGALAGLAAQTRLLREAIDRVDAAGHSADHAEPEENRPTEQGGQ